MKLLKGTRSFRTSKKKSPSSVSGSLGASDSGLGQSASPLELPASGTAEEMQPLSITPPNDIEPETRQEASPNAAVVPASPSHSISSVKSGCPSLRPLRLGSFNFSNPAGNHSVATGRSTPRASDPSFPPLFDEADDMLNISNLIYTLAELRDLARNGVLADPARSTRILDLPLPLETALSIIGTEKELLKEVLDDGKHEATLSALESLLTRQRERRAAKEATDDEGRDGANGGKIKEEDGGMFGWMTGWDGCLAGGFSFDELFCGNLGNVNDGKASSDDAGAQQQRQAVESSMITAVGDLRSNEELVYAVGVNPAEMRITVVFRGSVTKNDFMTDAKIAIVKAVDPHRFNGTESEDSTGGDVGIHQGFYEYLFGEKEGGFNKYAEIMKHIGDLLHESPSRRGYKLYVTGHSLGGALATLFGFYAAASTILPMPVTIVSVASPRVGNLAFARTFAEMESQGKIRHLRIANHKDPVTLGPTVSSRRALALSAKCFSPLGYLALALTGNCEGGEDEMYYHTGMKMKLFKDVSAVGSQRCELSYSGTSIVQGAKRPVAIDKDDAEEIEQSNKRKRKESSAELPMVSYHYGTSYSERMAAVESDLKGLTLNNMYREKACGMPWVV